MYKTNKTAQNQRHSIKIMQIELDRLTQENQLHKITIEVLRHKIHQKEVHYHTENGTIHASVIQLMLMFPAIEIPQIKFHTEHELTHKELDMHKKFVQAMKDFLGFHKKIQRIKQKGA